MGLNLPIIGTCQSTGIFRNSKSGPKGLYDLIDLFHKKMSGLLTHCPRISIFECRFCGKRGEDCLRTYQDCLDLNQMGKAMLERRIHRRDEGEDLIFIARILCKRCSLWHIRHSLGVRLFDVRILTSSSFPDQQQEWISFAGGHRSYLPPDLVLTEDQKPPHLGMNFGGERLVCGWTCTACHFHRSSGMCKRCRAVNEQRMRDRIRLINGHLHIIDAYCDWHNFSLYPIYHHHYMIRPCLPAESGSALPTPLRRHHPYSDAQLRSLRARLGLKTSNNE